MDGVSAVERDDPRWQRAIPRSCQPTTGVDSISLILPAYNESEGIAVAIAEADTALASLTADYEVIIVDDGSTDDTFHVARQAAQSRPHVRIIRLEQNQGYGSALRVGFQAASKQLIGFTDADCQFDLTELDRLASLTKHYDIACGYRIDRQDPWIRKAYSAVYNTIVRNLLGTRVRDCDCALKLFRRDVIRSIPLQSQGFFFNSEVLARARLQGYTVVEVGVTHRPRQLGTSTVSIKQVLPVSTAILKFWWNEILFPPTHLASTDSDRQPQLSNSLLWGALLAIACSFIFFLNLNFPLFEPDESRYAQIASEMIDQQDWVTPRLLGTPYLDKPPLLYWLTAASLISWGETPAGARLPVVLSAVFTVVTTYLLGRKLLGEQAARYSTVALLLSGGYVLSGRFLIMDGLLTLFTTTAILSGALSLQGTRLRTGWWWLSSVACALGVLTKGPIALVLCLPPLFMHQWLTNHPPRIGFRQWLLYGVPTVALTLPWFVAISLANPDFSLHFLWEHHVVRFASAFNHREPWWFYVPVLFVAMFPTSLLLPSLVVFLLGRSPQSRAVRSEKLSIVCLSALWTLLFFSLSTCKLPTYILPCVPMICLLLGQMLQGLVINPQATNGITRYLIPFPRRATAIAVGVLVAGVATDGMLSSNSQPILIVTAVLGLLLGVVLFQSWRHPFWTSSSGWAGSAAVAMMVLLFIQGQWVPDYSRQRSVLESVRQLVAENPTRQVVCIGPRPYAAEIQLPDVTIETVTVERFAEFAQALTPGAETIIIAPRGLKGPLLTQVSQITNWRPIGHQGKLFLSTTSGYQDSQRMAETAASSRR